MYTIVIYQPGLPILMPGQMKHVRPSELAVIGHRLPALNFYIAKCFLCEKPTEIMILGIIYSHFH